MPIAGHMAFKRFGRTRQLRINSPADLARVVDLDEAHWMALGAPVGSLNCDADFLAMVDSDSNGRIMCFELREAVAWLLAHLQDTSGLAEASESLALDAINTDSETGRQIYDSAAMILQQLDCAEAGEVTIDQVHQVKALVEQNPVSEAGVVLPEAADDDEVARFIADVIACVGGAEHPSGKVGIDREEMNDFLVQAQAYLDWQDQRTIPAGQTTSDIMPLGERTCEAYDLYVSLRDKIEQYFAQCKAAAFDARAAERVAVSDADLQAIDLSDPEAIRAFMAAAPLAKPRADQVLAFEDPVNPFYFAQLARLRTEVVEPALGREAAALTEKAWRKVERFFDVHDKWIAAKAGQDVEDMDNEALARYLDPRFRDAVEQLIAASTQTAFVLGNIRLTQKLLLYQAHLTALANNFVSFPHLYDPTRRAMFEMGTLIMDGRHFDFCLLCVDRARHAKVAATGNMCVLYVEVCPADAATYELAVPVTSGGLGNLCVGKRGMFRTVDGAESDARVVRIIDNPISISEAIVSPFKRLGRLLTGKIEAFTTKAEKTLDSEADAMVSRPAEAQPAAKPAESTSSGLLAGGLLMGGSVAIAALTSAAAYITKTLAGVETYKILIGLAAAVMLVMLPTTIVAIIKLRRRDLSALLEGSGWGINARMRLTFRQGRFFTSRPWYPGGAVGTGVRHARLLVGLFIALCHLVGFTLWWWLGG